MQIRWESPVFVTEDRRKLRHNGTSLWKFLEGVTRNVSSDLDKNVEIALPKSACLILFELLTRSYEIWRQQNPDDARATPMIISAKEHGERVALWKLEGTLERTLPELFSADYEALLGESRQRLGAS